MFFCGASRMLKIFEIFGYIGTPHLWKFLNELGVCWNPKLLPGPCFGARDFVGRNKVSMSSARHPKSPLPQINLN